MKALVTLLFVQILALKAFIPAMDTFELVKLPTLIEHFNEHQKENPDLSFWEYLVLHYENPIHHSEDHQKHSNLPFGNHHHDSFSLQVWFSNVAIPPALTGDFADVRLADSYTMPVNYSFSTSIWQPPRQV
jgi:hypothetical protein